MRVWGPSSPGSNGRTIWKRDLMATGSGSTGCIGADMIEAARGLAGILARSSGVFRALRFALNGRFAPCIVRRIEPFLAAPVLDIGCGTGELAHFIRLPYVGIDTDTVFLPAAKREVRRGWVLAADGSRLPFRSGVFGSALLIQAMHHLSDDLTLAIRRGRRTSRRVIVVDDHPARADPKWS